jgi:hypothetical protein
MEILIFIIFIFLAGLFGWLCADAVIAIRDRDSRKSWLGWVIMLVGLLYMWCAGWQRDYSWKHRDYDSTKYEIVRDTTITNHNGQIDTTATFKVVKK